MPGQEVVLCLEICFSESAAEPASAYAFGCARQQKPFENVAREDLLCRVGGYGHNNEGASAFYHSVCPK